MDQWFCCGGASAISGLNEEPSIVESSSQTQLAPEVSWGFKEAFADYFVRHAILSYMFTAACDIIFIETFPLLCILAVAKGGLGMEPAAVGGVATLQGAFQLTSTFMFPVLQRRFGSQRVFNACSGICAVVVMLTASLNLFTDNAALMFGMIALHEAFRIASAQIAFSLALMDVATSAPTTHLGAVTGISQSCSALVRTVLPIGATPIFAWSVQQPLKSFPLNVYCVFLISGSMAIFALIHSLSRDYKTSAAASCGLDKEEPSTAEMTQKSAEATEPELIVVSRIQIDDKAPPDP